MTITRFAPSPTGYLHIGNLRPALFNYLIAQQAGGKFILRIDDTDPVRSKPEYVAAIKQDLTWLGISWDRVETQSSRLDRYAEVAQRLRDSNRLYECFETPVELDLKRKKQLNMGKPPVYDRSSLVLSDVEKDTLRAERGSYWRFKLDHQRIDWKDGILGDQSIDAASLSDPVLIRADGQVLYTLASVVDDTDMKITNVVRGLDHVTNTATQIQIINAIAGDMPAFAHHSMLTGPQGEALSKRLGSLSLRDFRSNGIEPMAIISLMARLGSSDPVELHNDMAPISAGFQMSKFGASPTKFDENDLLPLTAKLLHNRSTSQMSDMLSTVGVPENLAEPFWLAIRENITKTADIAAWWMLCQNGIAPVIAAEDMDFIAEAMALLPDAPRDVTTWKTWTNSVKEKTGRKGKTLFMPLRLALTGQVHGPDISKLLPLLQKVG